MGFGLTMALFWGVFLLLFSDRPVLGAWAMGLEP